MADDELAAALAEIREALDSGDDGRWYEAGRRLLAAVDAVLELHKPIDRGRVMACCEGCESVNGEFHEDCCHEWPCPTYEAIARELTGKDKTDG